MDKQQIEQKVNELQVIMSEYKGDFSKLEKELFLIISDYQKALDEEKLKQVRGQLV